MKFLFAAIVALTPSLAFAQQQSARDMIERQLGAQFVSLAECYDGSAQIKAALAAAEKERDELKVKLKALEEQKEKTQ